MIKAIVFDYFGVIGSDEYWQFVGEERSYDLENTYHNLAERVNRGELEWLEFMDEVAREKDVTTQAVIDMYNSHRINPQIVAYIKELKQKYRVSLLTNANSDYIYGVLEEADLRDLFETITISSELGFTKPDPRIYMDAAQKLSLEMSECLFIDDQIINVDGARKSGMQAVLYKNLNQLRDDLSTMGVEL